MEEKALVLKGLLEKAYRVEAGFENEANFRAFLESIDDEKKKVLFKLISDSERHKVILQSIAKDLGFELSERAEEFRFTDKRIFNEIYELELSAKSLYEQIAANFGDLLGEKIGLLRELAKEEEMHAKLVERFVDKTMRII